jgi:hypothetical protein
MNSDILEKSISLLKHAFAQSQCVHLCFSVSICGSTSSQVHQTNSSFVVGASGSQPRGGLLAMAPTSLIEICRPRVFGPLTSTSLGLQVCWLIF